MESKFDRQFDDWYNSYTYGSKLSCIRFIQRSNLSEEEKKIRILSHIRNLPEESQDYYIKIFL